MRAAVGQSLAFELAGQRRHAVASSMYASEIRSRLTSGVTLAVIWYVSAERGHRDPTGAVMPLDRWLACLRAGP